MKRYVKSSSDYDIPYLGDANYPTYILYDPGYAIPALFKYRQNYLHGEDRFKRQEGMYYTINEVSEDDGRTFRPLTDAERRYELVTGWLDVYPDGDVGFLWDGVYNHLGYLDGNKVIKESRR